MIPRRRLLALPAILALAGCESDPLSAAAPARSAPTLNFGGTDLAWIEINIAMNEGMSPLLALAPQRGSSAGRRLAVELNSANDQELASLRTLRDQAGLPAENPHEGMSMPGLVTRAEVAEAAGVSGAAFDKLLVQQVRAYLEQGAELATSQEKSGIERRTKDLAARMRTDRRRILDQLSTI